MSAGSSGPALALSGVGVLADLGWGEDGSNWVILACSMALLLVTFAAASETALQQTGVFRLRKLVSPGQSNGSSDSPWDEQNHTRLLLTMQTLHIIMLLNLGGLLLSLLMPFVQEIWQLFAGLTAAVILVVAVEIGGRSYARAYSQSVARYFLPAGLALTRLAAPFFWLLMLFLRPFTPSNTSTTATLADDLEELSHDIRQLQQQGLLEQDQGQILQSVFQFGETIAKEVMVPRVDMVCVELGSSLHQVLDLMIQCGYTRLPVYEESVDNILGLVHAKDLLRKLGGKDTTTIRQQPIEQAELREVLVVPGTKKIAKILRELQQKQITMAIVVDEYGGTDGLMTLEDIVEELVGEITDEYDQAHEGIQLLKDGSSVVDAKIVIEDVNEFLRLELPFDEHETLGGYVYGLFGRVPQEGEKVQVGDLIFTANSVHKQRIKRVHIQRAETSEEDPDREAVAAFPA
jgi:CBS domain containing-hemolysin-like protein